MHKTIIFDFFGVIHDDPLKGWLPEVAADKHKVVADTALQFDLGAIDYPTYLRHLSDCSGQPVSDLESKFGESDVNDDMVRLIAGLRPHLKLGLLSNSGSEEINPLLAKHDLRRLFDIAIVSSEVGLAKPDAAIFSHALERLGALPKETVFIDDSLTNVEAAARVGMHSLHFSGFSELRGKLIDLMKQHKESEAICAELSVI